jgi:hypothetical protein
MSHPRARPRPRIRRVENPAVNDIPIGSFEYEYRFTEYEHEYEYE